MEDYILRVFNNTAGFEDKHLSHTLSSLTNPGSNEYFPQYDNPHKLLEALIKAVWIPVIDMSMIVNGDADCKAFRAFIPGRVKTLHITQIPDDAVLKFMSRDPINPKVGCELYAYGVDPKCMETKYTSMLIGDGSSPGNMEVIWSILPGPIRPRREYVSGSLNETKVTKAEALRRGMSWAHIVNSKP